jgi:Na+-driven multidrug efflux pump
MKDLTQGSIPRHVIEMAVPLAIGMLVQTLYLLVDLYFVAIQAVVSYFLLRREFSRRLTF